MSNFEKLRDAPLHVLADPGGGGHKQNGPIWPPRNRYVSCYPPPKKKCQKFSSKVFQKRSTIFSSQVSSARSASASLSRPSPEDGFPKCRFPEPGRLIRCEGGSGVIFWGRTGWSPNKKHQFLKTYRIMHPYLC